MQASNHLLAARKELEGFTPVARHLPGDRPSVITYGYGDTDCQPGQCISEPDAALALRQRLDSIAQRVQQSVHVSLTQGQLDALCSFAYNIGFGDPTRQPPVSGFLTSTLLRKLNAGDYAGAAQEFPKWNRANGRVLAGLTKRRQTEQAWFLGA
jgi:lysozyme